MNILDDLLNKFDMGLPVRSVLVGAHWTVVCSRHCGMAATLTSNHPHGHVQVRDVGRLHQKSARELAELACSDELMEASIGVAAINSMLEMDESLAVEINASEVLANRGGERTSLWSGTSHLSSNCNPLSGSYGLSSNILWKTNILPKPPRI